MFKLLSRRWIFILVLGIGILQVSTVVSQSRSVSTSEPTSTSIQVANLNTPRTRMENSYRAYLESGNEAFIRMQIINDINYPNFAEAAQFIKAQRHVRSIQILLELLRAYNRYDLIEEVFFGSTDVVYKDQLKDLYYETLLQNLKYDELLSLLLNDFNIIGGRIVDHPNNAPAKVSGPRMSGMDHSIIAPLYPVIGKMREIAERGPLQQTLVEKAINHHIFATTKTQPSPRPKKNNYPAQILLNFIHTRQGDVYTGRPTSGSLSSKENTLRPALQNTLAYYRDFKLSFTTPPSSTNLNSDTKPKVSPTDKPIVATEVLNNQDEFFNLDYLENDNATLPENSPKDSQNNYLNDADNFFDLEGLNSQSAKSSRSSTTTPNPANPTTEVYQMAQREISALNDISGGLGVVFFILQEVTGEMLLNRLYQNGYYLSYIKLFRSKANSLLPPSPEYMVYRSHHDERLVRAIRYSRATINHASAPISGVGGSSENTVVGIPSAYTLMELFYDNDYRTIVERFRDYQQHHYYLLSLAKLGRWDEVLPLLQNNSKLLREYLVVQALFANPSDMFLRLEKITPKELKSWQLNILNLKESGFSGEEIAEVVAPALLKDRRLPEIAENLLKKKSQISSATTGKGTPNQANDYSILYEYAITAHALNLSERGKTEAVKALFRNHFNRLTLPIYQEQMLFLYGWAHLLNEREEAEKIFIRLLTLNPQSSYRFQIDAALGLVL